jgi:hypothetical protein
MNAIMNERAYKGLMICYTNIQLQMSLQKCCMCIHKCLTSRHDYSFGIAQGSMTSILKDGYEIVCVIGQVASPRGVPNLVALPCDDRMSI